MDFSLLHMGLIIVFTIIGIVFAITESSASESKILNSFMIGGIGAIVGFFLYYLGAVIIGLIVLFVVGGILVSIFQKKVIIINKGNKDDIDIIS